MEILWDDISKINHSNSIPINIEDKMSLLLYFSVQSLIWYDENNQQEG